MLGLNVGLTVPLGLTSATEFVAPSREDLGDSSESRR
jgi:hypothetical protein